MIYDILYFLRIFPYLRDFARGKDFRVLVHCKSASKCRHDLRWGPQCCLPWPNTLKGVLWWLMMAQLDLTGYNCPTYINLFFKSIRPDRKTKQP